MKMNPGVQAAVRMALKTDEEFFERHDIADESSGIVTEARKAWLSAVECEFAIRGQDPGVRLDTPLARRAFILGYRIALRTK